MKLGEFRDLLAKEPDDWPVLFEDGSPVGGVASWRGIYAQATLPRGREPRTVADLLSEVDRVLAGEERTGWKGGNYTYGPDTPLWADDRGDVDHRVPTGLRSSAPRRVVVTAAVTTTGDDRG